MKNNKKTTTIKDYIENTHKLVEHCKKNNIQMPDWLIQADKKGMAEIKNKSEILNRVVK